MKSIRSVIFFLLYRTHAKTYNRVVNAYRKYPDASLYELQHGVNSKASQAYRQRHPKEPEEDIFLEEEELKQLQIFCFRDQLEGEKYAYKGINLYFVEYSEMDYFESVREHFENMFSDYFGGMAYARNILSTCEASDIRSYSGPVVERDFIFDIGELKSAKLQYWGYWHNGDWQELKLFDGFEVGALEKILKRR